MAENAASPVRASLAAVVGVIGAVGLMLLLVTWAATIGPQEVITRDDPPSAGGILGGTSRTFPPRAHQVRQGGVGDDHDLLVTVVTIIAILLAAILILSLVISVVFWLLTRRWHFRREPDPEEVAFDPLEAPAALADAMMAGAAQQRHLLETGSPRNAIVACWHHFEDSAEAAGVRRKPWETSSEFTMQVLDRLSADGGAVLRLAELYRDARHSEHEVTEDSRRAAAENLDAIHRSLGVTAWSP